MIRAATDHQLLLNKSSVMSDCLGCGRSLPAGGKGVRNGKRKFCGHKCRELHRAATRDRMITHNWDTGRASQVLRMKF
jgi:hypothetical protein